MSGQIKVELQNFMGTDKLIAETAWVSSNTYENKELKTDADVERVIKMLVKEGHGTPFESVVMRFWIKMPIVTDRQHMTHRIASHNGMSGRYRTMPSEYLEAPDDIIQILGKGYLGALLTDYNRICRKANHEFKMILAYFKQAEVDGMITNKEYKRLREFFRGILPQNNMTERITTMNLRSFANYQRLRNSEHAQPEIREVAQQMLDQVKLKLVCPIAIQALEDNKWVI